MTAGDAPDTDVQLPSGASPTEFLALRGVRTHNLRGFDLDLPTRKLVVVTGPSGSGKSSLAFGTVHAESVRRFASATRAYEGAFTSIDPPDVDSVRGLGVTVALSQRAVVRNSRSSVATMSGVAEPIRRVFAATAAPTCPTCGGIGVRHDVSSVVDLLLLLPAGTRVTILAPIAMGDVADARHVTDALARAGFARARFDGQVIALDDGGAAARRRPKRVEAVIDRLVVRLDERDRLREAVELAYTTGDRCVVVAVEGQGDVTYSERPGCERCGAVLEPIDPFAFRRTDIRGACQRCNGRGSIDGVAIRRKKPSRKRATLDDGDEEAAADDVCPSCDGLGLGSAALESRALGLSFREIHSRTAKDLSSTLEVASQRRLVRVAVESVTQVLRFLVDVGLGHVSLGRSAATLSNGELARVRLAGLLANELVGITYVLDEPTAGLHALERPAIVRAIRGLVTRGNSVICVEHDRSVVEAADFVVELGPGAGDDGGQLVGAGHLDQLAPSTLTARLVHDELQPFARDARALRSFAELTGVDVAPFYAEALRFPVSALTVIAGPSGSGKSTLLSLLARAHADIAEGLAPREGIGAASGFESFGKCVRLDDVTSAPQPRSLVATRLGIFGALRDVYASLPDARVRGFDAARFGLHAAGGRCEACAGLGRIVLQAVAGVAADVACERCAGSRYDASVLGIRYRGVSIADVLRGTVDESCGRFESLPRIHKPLATAARLGVGHLTLGRALSDTSGGEQVRLRLAAELAGRSSSSLILLDEPTRGLHAIDVRRMVDALDELVRGGATVVVADHALELIACADHVVDLGIVEVTRRSMVAASGTPSSVASAASPTAESLGRYLAAFPR